MKEYKLIATAASGIEALVGRELKDLGIPCEVENGRAIFHGDLETIGKANLWLRTADRIKIVIGEFEAMTFESLFDQVKELPWEDFLPMDAEFPVSGKSIKSTLFSVSDCQALTKKAIVNRLSDYYSRYGRLPETGAKFPIEVALLKDKVTITLDTTGSSLFKRGYRLEKGGAPLKENMAAAIISLTTWRNNRPFYDPVCGSGTFCIEAALMGRNIAPGLQRDFLFEDWPWVDDSIMLELRKEAKAAINHEVELDILGTDIDHKMIEIAKENAKAAGVADDISFKQMQLKDFTTTKEYGVIVANPPYGERLGEEEEARKIYRQMGKVYKKLDTWSVYVLTSDLHFETYYNSKATKKRKLYNGAIRTDLFQYWGKRPPRVKREEA